MTEHTIAEVSLLLAAVAIVISVVAAAVATHFSRRGESREAERHSRERSAELEIVDAAFSDINGKIRRFTVQVRNIGAAVARRVNVVIVDGDNLDPIGLLAYRFYAAAITIPPGETVALEVEAGLGLYSKLWRFRLFWTDDDGDRVAEGPMCPRSFHPRSGFGPLIDWQRFGPARSSEKTDQVRGD